MVDIAPSSASTRATSRSRRPGCCSSLGLLFLVPVAWSAGRDPESRWYPRARNALRRLGDHPVPARVRARHRRSRRSTTCRRASGPPARAGGAAIGTLHWRAMSRFAEPPAPAPSSELNASIAFDWRLGPYDVAQSRAHVRMLAAQGIIERRATATRCSRRSTQVERELDEGTFPFAHDDEDIHMAIERRVTEIAGPVGGKLHTARSRNDQVATDMAMFVRAHARARGRGPARELMATLVDARRAPPRLADARLHAPAARPARLPLPPPAGLLLDARRATATRFAAASRAADRAAARRRRPGRRELRHRPGGGGRELGFAARAPRTRSTPSPTATSCSTTSPPAATCATHLSRLGAEIVLWSSERVRLLRGLRRLSPRAPRSCRRRRTPTRPSCCAPRPRGSPGTSSRCTASCTALPLTYNKDMQEDKEHLFDAVDTLELCLAAAPGMLAGIPFRRERLAAAAADEFLAATDVADLLVRSGRPLPRGARRGRRARAPRARAAAARSPSCRREELAEHSRALDDEFYAVLGEGAGWSPRSRRAAPRSSGCASSSSRRAPGSLTGSEPAASATSSNGRSSTWLATSWAASSPTTGRGGRDRRGRGLPRVRARVSRLRRAHAAHGDPVRPARPGLRLPLLRNPRHAQRRLARPRARGRPC